MFYTHILIWSNIYIMNMLWTIVGICSFLEWVTGFEALEEEEGLDPTWTTSNIGPLGNTYSSYFSSLSIKITCLFCFCWCMPSSLLCCLTHTLGRIIPITSLRRSVGEALVSQFELDFPLIACMVTSVMGSVWYLDSRASFHMIGNKGFFNGLEDKGLQMHINMGDNGCYSAIGIGIVTF